MNGSLSTNASSTRYTRRLSDHVLIAFHHACDQGEIEVARRLLEVLEFIVRRPQEDQVVESVAQRKAWWRHMSGCGRYNTKKHPLSASTARIRFTMAVTWPRVDFPEPAVGGRPLRAGCDSGIRCPAWVEGA